MLGAFASRICGSEDIYAKSGKGPESSINFITCHDGFTLNDLVTFADKHNLANGEQNRDGTNDNLSANYGVEGPTEDPYIDSLRPAADPQLFGYALYFPGRAHDARRR